MKTTFRDLLTKQRSGIPNWKPPERLLVFDPGETIGWSFFQDGYPKLAGQISWKDNGLAVEKLFDRFDPTEVLHEEFKLYPWARKEQTWSEFPTVQIIGVIRFLCRKREILCHSQGANDGKAFVTDAKLRQWQFYQSDKKHANDALRHGCHFLLFGGGTKRALPNGGSTAMPPDFRGPKRPSASTRGKKLRPS